MLEATVHTRAWLRQCFEASDVRTRGTRQAIDAHRRTFTKRPSSAMFVWLGLCSLTLTGREERV